MQPTITPNLLHVRVANFPGSSVGLLMNNMRTWLDHQGIQPAEFNATTLDVGSVAFDLGFQHLGQAALFRAAFAASSLPRAIFPQL